MSYNKIDGDYFANKAISTSDIKTLLENPFNYFNGIKKEPSKSMEFGTIIHKLVLESDLDSMLTNDNQKIVVAPEFGSQTLKANKEAKAKFLAENADAYIINNEHLECAKSVLNSPMGVFFKQKGEAESGYIGTIDKFSGVQFRCKADYFLENFKGKNFVLDLKTTQSSEANSFLRDIANYKYYIQAYIYSKLLNAEFKFIVVENKSPYMVASYGLSAGNLSISQEWQDIAERDISKALDILKNKEAYNHAYRVFGIENNETLKYKDFPLPPSWLLYQE